MFHYEDLWASNKSSDKKRGDPETYGKEKLSILTSIFPLIHLVKSSNFCPNVTITNLSMEGIVGSIMSPLKLSCYLRKMKWLLGYKADYGEHNQVMVQTEDVLYTCDNFTIAFQ